MPQYEDVYEPPVMDATFVEKMDELKEVLAPPIPDFVSDAFSVSRAYAVGEYCIYENHFYKFTSAKSAGAWDSTKVQETTLAAEQSSTNSNLAQLVYTDTTNGTAYNIPIEKLRLRRDFGIALVGAWKSLFVIFFNSDNTCAIYRLWSDNNMTATIAYSNDNVVITFNATVWGGISVIPF